MAIYVGREAFFLSLSYADLRQDESMKIITKINWLNISDDEIREMSYYEQYNILNSNPVPEARHFQFRFELLFKVLILIKLIRSFSTDPWEKTHFALIFVEFPI